MNRGSTTTVSLCLALALIACCTLVAACADNEPGESGGGGGAPGDGGSGGGRHTCPPSSQEPSLVVKATAEVTNEPWVSGLVSVAVDGRLVHDASVTLNDVPLPPGMLDGSFDIPATVDATIGDTLLFCANAEEGWGSLSIPCPEIAITSPAEGTPVSPGESLTIRWTGDAYVDGASESPALGISGYPAGTMVTATPQPGESSVTVVVPETQENEYVIRFSVPGALVKNGDEFRGLCKSNYRVILTKR